MRIAMTGASGLVGTALTARLRESGHEVTPMVRSTGQPGILYDVVDGVRDPAQLEGMDAIVHLAGASIGDGRWSDARKKVLVSSRVDSAKSLIRAVSNLQQRPQVIVSSSAIGFYGDRGDEEVDESSAPGRGFLADLCREWEDAFAGAQEMGIRVVNVRTGIVLDQDAGALPKMVLPIKLGAGGKIGSGRQWMSWITTEDIARVYQFALENLNVTGPVNGVAPGPVTNETFTKHLGKILGRPTFLPLPAFAVKLMFGEMGEELLLSSTRVKPAELMAQGFDFQHAEAESALRSVLGR